MATGLLTFVPTALSGQTGRPSGAQSGLPSKLSAPGSWASEMGERLLASEFAITSSPFENVPRTYVIFVPSGDHVQLMFPCGSSCEILVSAPGVGRSTT